MGCGGLSTSSGRSDGQARCTAAKIAAALGAPGRAPSKGVVLLSYVQTGSLYGRRVDAEAVGELQNSASEQSSAHYRWGAGGRGEEEEKTQDE